eukprot:TRINITY_DN35595_c0_g1_i1.p2 TRINITY_DN35595_c0_g1~~TRINITY_DN35595_c0_g1_i1.p2  ORF type:complete len:337 (+),score=85.11 TRINITY_DN35595_c0_g1_i1:90-1100(+)
MQDITIRIPGPGEPDGPRREADHAEYCVVLCHVSGAHHRSWHRYSEFRALLSAVRSEAPGVPPPPPKKLFGNQLAPELLAARAARLQLCLHSAAAAPELRRSRRLTALLEDFAGVSALRAERGRAAKAEEQERRRQEQQRPPVAWRVDAARITREEPSDSGSPRLPPPQQRLSAAVPVRFAQCRSVPVMPPWIASTLPAAALREEPAESPCSSPASEPDRIPVCGEVVLAALRRRPPTPPIPRPDPNRPPLRRGLQSAMRGGRGLPRTPYVRNIHAHISTCAPTVVTVTDADGSPTGGGAQAARAAQCGGKTHSRGGGGWARRAAAAAAGLLRRRR